MDDDTRAILKDFSTEKMLDIWRAVKSEKIEDLEGEDRLLATLFQEHIDTYGEEFDAVEKRVLNEDESSEEDEDEIEDEQDPFFHIVIHAIIENQLQSKTPIEVLQFYNAMRKKKIDRHETIHLIGCFLVNLLYDVMVQGKSFDLEHYKLLLTRYKGKKPDSIYTDLDNGFR